MDKTVCKGVEQANSPAIRKTTMPNQAFVRILFTTRKRLQ